jgi:hypothetical protein
MKHFLLGTLASDVSNRTVMRFLSYIALPLLFQKKIAERRRVHIAFRFLHKVLVLLFLLFIYFIFLLFLFLFYFYFYFYIICYFLFIIYLFFLNPPFKVGAEILLHCYCSHCQ